MNEGLKQVDQDLAKQIKQQGASGPIDCALLGRKVSQAECVSKNLGASQEDFARCLECPQGQDMAATSPFGRGSLELPFEFSLHKPLKNCGCALPPEFEQAGQQEPAEHTPSAREIGAEQESAAGAVPALCGWELVKAKTGIESHNKLADTLRCTQSAVSHVFRKVAAGEMPRGKIWSSVLALSGLTAEQIMRRPLTAEERGPAPGGWPKGKRRKHPAAEPENSADLDVAMSHAEPGTISEEDLMATRQDVAVQAIPLSEIPLEDLLHVMRNRLPGMRVTISVEW